MDSINKDTQLNNTPHSYYDYDIISNIFAILYENADSVNSINIALKAICEYFNADRCFIFESFDLGKTYKNTYEYCKDGIVSASSNFECFSNDFFGNGFGHASGGILYSTDVSEYSSNKPLYEYINSLNTKSFLHVQVKKDNFTAFSIGIDDCTSKREWNNEEKATLKYLSKIISVAVLENHSRNTIKVLDETNKFSAYISENSADLVYVADTKNYDLLYLNKTGDELIEKFNYDSWRGKKCYEVLQGRAFPCEFCTNRFLNQDEFYEWTYTNPRFDKTYLLKDKLIKFGDSEARLEIATDITKIISLEKNLEERLEEERLLIKCIETLHSSENPRFSINKLLSYVGKYHQAEHSYIFEISPDGKFLNNTYEWCSMGCEPQIDNLVGIPRESIQDIFDSFIAYDEYIVYSLQDEVPMDSFIFKCLDAQRISSLLMVPLRDSAGTITGLFGVDNPEENSESTVLLRSVSKFIANYLAQTELLAKLNQLSYFDTLTGLKNRQSYRKTLKSINVLPVISLGVAYIDVQSLATINVLMGTDFGDKIIIRTADILSEIFGDNCYRVSGDEFVVIEKNAEEKKFERNINLFKKRIEDEKDFEVSVGYTWNKNYYMFEKISNSDILNYDSELKRYTEILYDNLEREIKSDKYIVYLQPQYNLATGKQQGAEALIRRLNSDGSVLYPQSFIPFYEKEGIISRIDLFVCESVCKFLKKLKDKGQTMKIAINCSRITVSQKNICEKFTEICDKYSIDKSQIIIEITETIKGMSEESFNDIVNNFKMSGFDISLDDFGKGYSNLSALINCNFDEVKVDMSIIKQLSTDSKSRFVTESTLNLCKNLGNIISVAEGIETEAQYSDLISMKCDKGQGFYLGKPMSMDDFEKRYPVAE